MVLHTQPQTGTLMAMAHALERNRHTNSRQAYNHPEKGLPEPHSDTARQLVAQSQSYAFQKWSCIQSPTPGVSPLPSHVSQSWYIYCSYPPSNSQLYYVTSSQKNKQSLFLQTRRSHRQVQDHVQSQPHVDRHTISHTQKHQHTISISHTQMEHL